MLALVFENMHPIYEKFELPKYTFLEGIGGWKLQLRFDFFKYQRMLIQFVAGGAADFCGKLYGLFEW